MQKVTIWICVMTIVALAICNNINAQSLEMPCQLLTQGNKWVYMYSTIGSNEQKSIPKQELTVVFNDNNNIHILTKQFANDDISFNILMKYVYDGKTLFLKSTFVESDFIKTTTTYIKPEPFCGQIPTEWETSTEMLSKFSDFKPDAPHKTSHKNTIKYLGKENIKLNIGNFSASVFEKIISNFDDKDQSYNVTILYAVKDIGIVKSVNVIIRKDKIRKMNPTIDAEVEQKIQQGLKDLQNGKDVSEIDFFKDSSIYQNTDNANAYDYHTRKTIVISELIDYNVK